MGMYTEIFVNVDLKPETPEEVLAVLRAEIVDVESEPNIPPPETLKAVVKMAEEWKSPPLVGLTREKEWWRGGRPR